MWDSVMRWKKRALTSFTKEGKEWGRERRKEGRRREGEKERETLKIVMMKWRELDWSWEGVQKLVLAAYSIYLGSDSSFFWSPVYSTENRNTHLAGNEMVYIFQLWEPYTYIGPFSVLIQLLFLLCPWVRSEKLCFFSLIEFYWWYCGLKSCPKEMVFLDISHIFYRLVAFKLQFPYKSPVILLNSMSGVRPEVLFV